MTIVWALLPIGTIIICKWISNSKEEMRQMMLEVHRWRLGIIVKKVIFLIVITIVMRISRKNSTVSHTLKRNLISVASVTKHSLTASI